ncbi:MAG TPA: hypothetical protein VGD21_09770 [Lysobacter sp.]
MGTVSGGGVAPVENTAIIGRERRVDVTVDTDLDDSQVGDR